MSERHQGTRIRDGLQRASTRLSVGSLFAGIGGLDLGLEWAGMDVAWQVEIDPFCRDVLARHWPDVPRYGDVTELDFEELEPVDVICGGFPCQPVAVSGRQQAQDDERWLWPYFAQCVRVLRPRYVLVENSPNLLRVNEGRAFSEVLGDLASLGFAAEWSLFTACQVGAPHMRERLFLVAYPDKVDGTEGLGTQPHGQGAVPDLRGEAGAWRDRVDRSLEAARPDDREDDGVARQMVGAAGNAVVPQVAEFVGRLVIAHAERMEVAA